MTPFFIGPFAFEKKTFGIDVMTCRCFEYGR